MELRARENTFMAHDLIPSIPPIAASLHDCYLASHCSACFRPLPNFQNAQPPPPCAACNASVSYCSLNCYGSDAGLHSSSGECRLLGQSPLHTWHPGESSDIRAALRLLRSLETHGLTDSRSPPGRIGGGLSSRNMDAVLGEGSGSEMAERIRQGAALMRRARNEKEAREEEEEVLWAVLTNAVEVQVGEGRARGIAVYGPWFSWFNHSCSPNACYRIELTSCSSESLDSFDLDLMRVLPASNGEAPEL